MNVVAQANEGDGVIYPRMGALWWELGKEFAAFE